MAVLLFGWTQTANQKSAVVADQVVQVEPEAVMLVAVGACTKEMTHIGFARTSGVVATHLVRMLKKLED